MIPGSNRSLLHADDHHREHCDDDDVRIDTHAVTQDEPREPGETTVVYRVVVCESCGATDYEVV